MAGKITLRLIAFVILQPPLASFLYISHIIINKLHVHLEALAGLSTFIRVQNDDGISFEIEIGFEKCSTL